MKTADILFHAQSRLIQDLIGTVQGVKACHAGDLHNVWILEQLEVLVRRLKPARIANISYGRKELERDLSILADKKLGLLREHVPEIEEKDLKRMIAIVGSLYGSMSARARAELKRLESNSSRYKTAESLVQKEFQRSKAFKSKAEHERWLAEVTGDLGGLFDWIADIGQVLSEKTGILWSVKLAMAQTYLKGSFGIRLSLDALNEDIAVVRKAVIDGYSKYEKGLISSRYPSSPE